MLKHCTFIFLLASLLVSTFIVSPAVAQERGIVPVPIKNPQGQRVLLYQESHALVVGVSKYENSNWPALRGVRDDVRVLSDTLRLNGFHVETVENPSHSELVTTLDNFIKRYGLNTGNRLLFYFAGHGYTHKPSYASDDPEEWNGYFLTTDTPDPNSDLGGFKARALSMQRIEELALKIEAKHALFLFDSCFSGSLFALQRALPHDIEARTARPVRQFITAGSADETVPDTSIFRRQFVSAIDGEADRNRDGYVTGSELGMFLEETVINLSRRTQTPQYGKIRHRRLNKGDFVFSMLAREEIRESVDSIIEERKKLEQDRLRLEEERQRVVALQRRQEEKRKLEEERIRLKEAQEKLARLQPPVDSASLKVVEIVKVRTQLNVRSEPEIRGGNIVYKLRLGKRVPVLSENEDWYQVEYVPGKAGWIPRSYARLQPSTDPAIPAILTDISKQIQTFHTVIAPLANVWAEPSTESKVVTVVEKGMSLDVLEDNGLWSKIQVFGKTGWISNKLKEPPKKTYTSLLDELKALEKSPVKIEIDMSRDRVALSTIPEEEEQLTSLAPVPEQPVEKPLQPLRDRLGALEKSPEKIEIDTSRDRLQPPATSLGAPKGMVRINKKIQEEQLKSSNDLNRIIARLEQKLALGGERLDITDRKGRLPVPVRGHFLNKFGQQRDNQNNTSITYNGIYIRSSRGTPVRSVFDGNVLYTGAREGYGNLVILGHGKDYRTLYGHLDEIVATVGRRVRLGQIIGRAGDTGSLVGEALYFEIRHKGKPIEPTVWFQRSKKTTEGKSDLLKELDAAMAEDRVALSTIPEKEEQLKSLAPVPEQPVEKPLQPLRDKLGALEKSPVKIEIDMSQDRAAFKEFQSGIRKIEGLLLPQSSKTTKPEISAYIGKIYERVYSKWKTPPGYQKWNKFSLIKDLQVDTTFTIFKGGNIDKPVIRKSAGDEELDSLALQAIHDSAPFPPLPKEWKRPHFAVGINFKYIPEAN